jgi:hypothetical protein
LRAVHGGPPCEPLACSDVVTPFSVDAAHAVLCGQAVTKPSNWPACQVQPAPAIANSLTTGRNQSVIRYNTHMRSGQPRACDGGTLPGRTAAALAPRKSACSRGAGI